MRFAVCGLHLRGAPLNHQLVTLHATFIQEALSSPNYTMHALHAPKLPTKPGMIHHPTGGPACGTIAVELWDVPDESIGPFLNLVPPPLAFGTVVLQDGELVKGFVCEGWAADPAAAAAQGITSEDITRYGGWNAWVEATSKDSAAD